LNKDNYYPFEEVESWAKKHTDIETILPERQTAHSAGYDFRIKEDLVIYPGEQKMSATDVKCKIPDGHVLFLIIRSSMGIKKKLSIANQVGVIDSDYYGNDNNDGNIMVALRNNGTETVYLKAGERVMQGVIVPVFVDNSYANKTRTGGIGSTGV